MSKLIIEVCKIDAIEDHPNADRMKISIIKGWRVCIKHDPTTNKSEFEVGQKCVFFPPDSILPPAICNGPNDPIPGRLDNMKYLHELPKENGVRPVGGRVTAARLRGQVSYGVIMPVDPVFGDDPNWEIGTDVAEYFGIKKYEPPLETAEGDEERSNSRFYAYTSIEHAANYPTAFLNTEEVVFTEKIHGKNCRLGLALENDETGNAVWTLMAGSHGVRRKQYVRSEHRFKVAELIETGHIKSTPVINQVLLIKGLFWHVDAIIEPHPDYAESVQRVHCHQISNQDPDYDSFDQYLDYVDGNTNNWQPVQKISEYWLPLTDNVVDLLKQVREIDWPEPKHSIMLYGEIYGAGVQDMAYGLNTTHFRAFDISINNQYLDFDVKTSLFTHYKVDQVPVLYRGPFSQEILETFTSGPTTICASDVAGKFKGREGIVVTPTKEVHYCKIVKGRKILKSVSADYLARRGGTEFH